MRALWKSSISCRGYSHITSLPRRKRKGWAAGAGRMRRGIKYMLCVTHRLGGFRRLSGGDRRCKKGIHPRPVGCLTSCSQSDVSGAAFLRLSPVHLPVQDKEGLVAAVVQQLTGQRQRPSRTHWLSLLLTPASECEKETHQSQAGGRNIREQ